MYNDKSTTKLPIDETAKHDWPGVNWAAVATCDFVLRNTLYHGDEYFEDFLTSSDNWDTMIRDTFSEDLGEGTMSEEEFITLANASIFTFLFQNHYEDFTEYLLATLKRIIEVSGRKFLYTIGDELFVTDYTYYLRDAVIACGECDSDDVEYDGYEVRCKACGEISPTWNLFYPIPNDGRRHETVTVHHSDIYDYDGEVTVDNYVSGLTSEFLSY